MHEIYWNYPTCKSDTIILFLSRKEGFGASIGLVGMTFPTRNLQIHFTNPQGLKTVIKSQFNKGQADAFSRKGRHQQTERSRDFSKCKKNNNSIFLSLSFQNYWEAKLYIDLFLKGNLPGMPINKYCVHGDAAMVSSPVTRGRLYLNKRRSFLHIRIFQIRHLFLFLHSLWLASNLTGTDCWLGNDWACAVCAFTWAFTGFLSA